MRSMKILSAALLLGLAGTASAGSSKGTMQVSADAINTCYVQSGTLDFGQIPAVINTPIDGVGSLDIQCSPDTAWALTADAGLHDDQAHYAGELHMEAAGEYLSYSLYTDASRTTLLDGFGMAQINGQSSATGGVEQVPIYGQINSGQIVRSNSYYDSVGFTATF